MSTVDHSRYGVGHFRPRCLQFLNTPAFFLAFTALAVFILSMCVNGLVGVSISTLERRYARILAVSLATTRSRAWALDDAHGPE